MVTVNLLYCSIVAGCAPVTTVSGSIEAARDPKTLAPAKWELAVVLEKVVPLKRAAVPRTQLFKVTMPVAIWILTLS